MINDVFNPGMRHLFMTNLFTAIFCTSNYPTSNCLQDQLTMHRIVCRRDLLTLHRIVCANDCSPPNCLRHQLPCIELSAWPIALHQILCTTNCAAPSWLCTYLPCTRLSSALLWAEERPKNRGNIMYSRNAILRPAVNAIGNLTAFWFVGNFVPKSIWHPPIPRRQMSVTTSLWVIKCHLLVCPSVFVKCLPLHLSNCCCDKKKFLVFFRNLHWGRGELQCFWMMLPAYLGRLGQTQEWLEAASVDWPEVVVTGKSTRLPWLDWLDLMWLKSTDLRAYC